MIATAVISTALQLRVERQRYSAATESVRVALLLVVFPSSWFRMYGTRLELLVAWPPFCSCLSLCIVIHGSIEEREERDSRVMDVRGGKTRD